MKNNFKKFIENLETTLDTSKYFVPFFKKNMQKNYRGNHSFAQERISLEQLSIIIETIFDICEDKYFIIPPTPKDKESHQNISYMAKHFHIEK